MCIRDRDATVLDGAAPEIEGLIMAAGTISFFGTRRVVVLPEVDPGAYDAKDPVSYTHLCRPHLGAVNFAQNRGQTFCVCYN